ncbi:MAG TPA: 4-alpha-glucanotransferase [Candidatus Didemnitutus sp.]|nr:4-alpha-glucanotransferase [Candidatus Didemnitutus sp.]
MPSSRKTSTRNPTPAATALQQASAALGAVAAPMAAPDEAGDRPGPLFDWLRERGAGVLFHPTCLPGNQGIGVFDENLVAFLDLLKAAGIGYWQLCPLGPTGYGDSPYQCFSAFAGNPLLIDLAALVKFGLLTTADLAPLAALPADRVDYGALFNLKWPLLFAAHRRYLATKPALPYGDFAAFKKQQAIWLEPYAYFRALKDHFGGGAWDGWPADVRRYQEALASPLRQKLADAIDAHAFTQYLFFGQWANVRTAAAARGIQIIGDLPIFVAGDSADAWSAPQLFELDPATMRALAVAGVPPDYFSEDGQLWGNPLYRWDVHAADGYGWWLARLRAAFELYDVVRIDHFRGFDAYWRIPWPAKTARKGEWVPGPGLDLFHAVHHAFPAARIIAEDLGVLTDSVRELLRATGLPGMLVLQFAFGGDATNGYLPHNHTINATVYPGTHDNDTTLGWYRATDERTRDHVRRYLRVSGDEVGWDFLRSAYASPARLAIVSLPDLLSLGSAARFNTPSLPQGNWQWRCTRAQLDGLAAGSAAYLKQLAELYGR